MTLLFWFLMTWSKYPRSWAPYSDTEEEQSVDPLPNVEIPSQLGTLFGPAVYDLGATVIVVEIPSQLGTLFGQGEGEREMSKIEVEIPSQLGTLFGQTFQSEGPAHHWRAVCSYPMKPVTHLPLTFCASSCTLNHP